MLYYFLHLLSGMLQGVMVSLNGQLGNFFSLFGVTFFVHGIALLLLLLWLLLIRRQPIHVSGAPWYVYLVGILGIALVASSSWCTLRIGAGAMLALSTVGQLISSELIDCFGLFGMQKCKPNLKQLPGWILILTGVALVVFC